MKTKRILSLVVIVTLLLALTLIASPVTPTLASPSIETLRPNEAGDVTQLTKSGGTYNWEMVDEEEADEAATNVSWSGLDTTRYDLYNLPSLGVGSVTINFIKVYVRSYTEYGGWCRIKIKTGGTEYDNGSNLGLSTTWTTKTKQWDTNPKTTAAWTRDDIDALQIGVLLFSYEGYNTRCTQVHVDVDYTLALPTVTTQACTNVQATTATGNGNITDTGGENCTTRGFCYKVGTSGDPTTADSKAFDTDSFGTGAYTKGITGLNTGTSYRVRAYAINSAGTGYGTTVQILTKPAAPTNVQATDGTYTDKVVITWTKSTGATGYQVYRDGSALGWLGDVATYNDTGAGAPTITPGATAASDGTYATHVALSLSGQSANNGTTHTYKVRAKNATGESTDSGTNTGYRSVGALTYQWQRSAADSDASYSNISGATTASYNDTGAPADGSGRYYRCIENATGATQQISATDRGYRNADLPTVTTQAVTDIGTTTATGNGTIVDIGAENCSKRGVCWNTTGNPTVAGSKSEEEGTFGAGAFTRSMTGLNPKQLYYVKAYAYNSAGYGYGEQVTFTTYGSPSVTTSAATSVAGTTATLNGEITATNGANATTRGFEWDTDSGEPYENDWHEDDSFGVEAFSHGLTSLTKGELYFFRAYATNIYGTSYGEEVTFLTKPDAPFNLMATATGNGTITLTWNKGQGAQKTYITGKDGGYPANRADGYEVYFDIGITVDDTGRIGGHTYYYKVWSYATKGGVEQYSDNYGQNNAMAITRPIVTTNTPESIQTVQATLKATITSVNGDNCNYRGFVWDTESREDPGGSEPPGTYSGHYTEGPSTFGIGAFTHLITGLEAEETYYVRGCAQNLMGWDYGAEVSFTTGTVVQHIVWQYSATLFTDLSGYDHDAEPTFRTESTNLDVSATLISFQPVGALEPPTFPPAGAWELMPGIPDEPGHLYIDEPDMSFLGAGYIQEFATTTGMPLVIPVFVFAFGSALLLGLLAYGLTMGKHGRGSLLVQALVSLLVLVYFVITGDGVIPAWCLLPFGLEAIAAIMWRQPYHF